MAHIGPECCFVSAMRALRRDDAEDDALESILAVTPSGALARRS